MNKKRLLAILLIPFFLTGCNASNTSSIDNNVINGVDGKDGQDGKDGTNGQDGKDGVDGQDGKDGTNGQDGKDGTNGQDGKDGVDGQDGKDGASVLSGIGRPTPELGNVGDSYIDYSTWDLYKKSDDGWHLIDNIKNSKHNKYSKVNESVVLLYQGEDINLPTFTFAYNKETKALEEVPVTWYDSESFTTAKKGQYYLKGVVEGADELAECRIIVKNYFTELKTVDGFVNGLYEGDEATVVLYNAEYIDTVKTTNGVYEFKNVPNGEYEIRAELEDYYPSDIQEVNIQNVDTSKLSLFDNVAHKYFSLKYVSDYSYYYAWNSNKYYFGNEVSSNIVKANNIELGGYKYDIPDNSAAISLLNKYNVVLSNDGDMEWNYQYSSALFDSFERLGETITKNSIWTISNSYLENDLVVEKGTEADKITISSYALKYASPISGKLNGVKGTFFSKRMYTAVTRYITDAGTDTAMVDRILKRNFAISIMVPDYEYLTRNTTAETATQFRQFTPEELLDILQMFEEMPTGFHKIDGFNYIIRRQNGHPHPIYPQAAAVTWPSEGYIEFMSRTFESDSTYFDRYRLLIHEKSHMVWAHVFSKAIRDEWARIGGWYQDANDPNIWYTTKTTEFVTQYAHDNNPDEDMAESMAYYILDPAALIARAPEKYEFLEKYVFNSNKYINEIRSDLTFEVYNLWPDYDYPGMIKKVEITSNSTPYEDKEYEITLYLNHIDGFQDDCSDVFTRITCLDDDQKIVDVYLYPVNGNGHILRGTFGVTKFTQGGYWAPESVRFSDTAGNKRYTGTADFGFKLYIDNPLQDLTKPELVRGSININVNAEKIDNPKYDPFYKYDVDISFQVRDEHLKQRNGAFTRIDPIDEKGERAVLDSWGHLESDGLYHIHYEFDDYSWNTEYAIQYIMLVDDGLNKIGYGRFQQENNIADENIFFDIDSNHEDIVAPVLDLNRISISATPVNPEAPDGETIVELTYYALEEVSGFDWVWGSFELVDPQGENHFEYIYSKDCTLELQNDGYYKIVLRIVLPRGSYPGIWGLYSLTLQDTVGNKRRYDFMEIVHFEVDD